MTFVYTLPHLLTLYHSSVVYSAWKKSTQLLASFPGPTQLNAACSSHTGEPILVPRPPPLWFLGMRPERRAGGTGMRPDRRAGGTGMRPELREGGTGMRPERREVPFCNFIFAYKT